MPLLAHPRFDPYSMAAQLSVRSLGVPGSENGRNSQLLPSVKCANCAVMIPLDALGEHICRSAQHEPFRSVKSPAPSARSFNSSPNSHLAPRMYDQPRSPSPLRAASTSPRPSFEQNQNQQHAMSPTWNDQQNWSRSPPAQQQQSPPQQAYEAPTPDTKTGGEAGMAGVGRRGFAAAAAAAMFATSNHADGRRANAPQYLDITPANGFIDRTTPPMSPHSPYSPSHTPQSPRSPGIPTSRNSPMMSTSPPLPSPRSAERVPEPRGQRPPLEVPDTKNDRHRGKSPVNDILDSSLSPTSTVELGYARRDTDEDEDDTGPRSRNLASPFSRSPAKSKDDHTRVDKRVSFPRVGTESMYSIGSLASDDDKTEAGGLEKFNLPPSSSVGHGANDKLKANLLQHPTRSKTSPTLSRTAGTGKDQPTTRRRTEKQCVKCGKKITDGKWIQVDSEEPDVAPSVLCEYDWKMLYLPKCRRCDKPIEGQAVGSADGQIKGKYHRDCFNCTTCQKSFPDKSFYVFDGKPFCEYHYHEANNSLCASPRCGMPIEGPCAVAHNGDRYHPAHFICESGSCKERLHDDYWEIDGKRYCDRHAQKHPMYRQDNLSDDEARDSMTSLSSTGGQTGRAQKRMTRYVDL